jgi:hypothetical protein
MPDAIFFTDLVGKLNLNADQNDSRDSFTDDPLRKKL